MDKQVIISIGREYGSGGHAIAELIAQDLNIPLYDRNMLDAIAEEMDTNVKVLEKYDEKPINRILSRRVGNFSNSMEDNLAKMQFDFLRKKAANGESFVVVGRCSEIVLKDLDCLISIFVLGDKKQKLERVKEKYKLTEGEAALKMIRHDRKRKQYHNMYSEYKWGDSRGYDLCINSSLLGWKRTAKLLEEYINERVK